MQSHERPVLLHCDLFVRYARPRISCCVVGDLTARLWRPNGDPTALLLEHRAIAERRLCFEHTQSAHRRSAFYAIPRCLVAMPPRCCGNGCDRTARTSAFCNLLGRRGNTVRTPPWCDGVLGNQHIVGSLSWRSLTFSAN